MQIRSITLSSFRCFGPDPTEVPLDPGLTALVGSNGSGKTALLIALSRLFGIARADRTVVAQDFHVPIAEAETARDSASLWIEARLEFPELAADAESDAVPPAFKHMVVDAPGVPPYCRIRLAAKWVSDGTSEGEVEQRLWWITDSAAELPADALTPVQPHERGLIQVQYLPAARGASSELQVAVRQMIERLSRTILWSQGVRERLESASEQAGQAFADEQAIGIIQARLTAHWQALHDAGTDATPELHLLSRRFEDMVRKIGVSFHPNEQGGSRELHQLSDGQKTLFYLAVVTAVFEIEREAIAAAKNVQSGLAIPFDTQKLRAPALTVFAIEEPENHLAPFYLSRIIGQLLTIATGPSAQAVVSSHSPAILGRVDPLAVRFCRLDGTTRCGTVRSLTLPDDDEQAAKYVRGAIQAYPELYFARFAILAEGDSEQVVLPRLARSLGLDVDPSFVAVVPLGGRHVNHFWRLLAELGIPYATLLDLDVGRGGGDWGRIHDAHSRLIALGYPRDQLLKLNGNEVLNKETFDRLPECPVAPLAIILSWVRWLEQWGVYFSAPLDLDLSMLTAFHDAYRKTATGQPRSSEESAADAILGTAGKGPAVYRDECPDEYALFPWYRYLFLTHSKPATHLRALAAIDDVELADKMPDVYRRLLNHVDTTVRRQQR